MSALPGCVVTIPGSRCAGHAALGADEAQVLVDFVRAARMFQRGLAEAAMASLLPVGLAEKQLHARLRLMVAVGAVLTGTLSRGRLVAPSIGRSPAADERVRVLASRFIAAGSRLDYGTIRELIVSYCGAPASARSWSMCWPRS